MEASQDAYIKQDQPWANYGTVDRLFATRGIDDQTTEKIYIMFDASEVPGEVIDIVDFQAVFRNQFARAGWAYLLTGPDANEWGETEITYDNAPANDYNHYGFLDDESVRLGYLEAVEQNETAGFVWDPDGDVEDLKAMVLSGLNTGERKVTIGIERSSTNRNLSYASRQSTQFHGPRLILEVQTEPNFGTVALEVSEDSYINQALPDMNFGDAERLFATQGINDEETEKIYLKFDASELPGDVVNILGFEAVYLNQFPRAGHSYLLTGPDATDWSEDTITYNNAPANDYNHYGFLDNESLHLGYFEMAEQGETAGFYWYSESVRNAIIEGLNSGDRTIAIGILRSSTNRNISYASKEHPDHHGARFILLVEGVEGDEPEGFDAWVAEHFNEEERNNPAISGPEASPAGDAIPNLIKYALGLNPHVSSRAGLPKQGVEEIEDVRYLTLTITRPDGIEDVGYSVGVTGDLDGWADEAVRMDDMTETNEDGTTSYTYRDIQPLGESKARFMQLRIEMN